VGNSVVDSVELAEWGEMVWWHNKGARSNEGVRREHVAMVYICYDGCESKTRNVVEITFWVWTLGRADSAGQRARPGPAACCLGCLSKLVSAQCPPLQHRAHPCDNLGALPGPVAKACNSQVDAPSQRGTASESGRPRQNSPNTARLPS